MYKQISNPKSKENFDTGTIEGQNLMNHYFTKLKDKLDLKLYRDSKINFKEFHTNHKNTVMDKVLEKSKDNPILSNLRKNYSFEGGFALPLTDEWKKAVEIENRSQSGLLKYHGDRDFRFFSSGDFIQGLRTKDSMRYWSEEEVEELKNIITLVVDEL